MSQSKEYKPAHGGYPGEVVVKDRPLQARLLQALDLIRDPAKWRKGRLLDEQGCMCFLGAVAAVNGISVPKSLAESEAAEMEGHDVYEELGALPEVRALGALIGARSGYISVYCENDSSPTHGSMIQTFEAAIAKVNA